MGFEDLESPEETWTGKSRQTFVSWETASFSTASMLTIPGWIAAVQSENEKKSEEFKNRCDYQLENLLGSFGGPVRSMGGGRKTNGVVTWKNTKEFLQVESVLGQPMRSELWSLAEGPSQWRFLALSLAILDEFSYIPNAVQCYSAASHCIDSSTGGKIVVIFTGRYDSFANKELLAMLERAVAA